MTPSPDQRVRAAVLGPVLIEGARGTLVEPPGAMARRLIVALALALAPRTQLSVAGLIDDLWTDAPPRNEKAALQTLVSRLRATSAPGLIASASNGYRLAISGEQCDLGRAQAHRDRAQRALDGGEHTLAEDEASEALDLWRGDPGADLGDGDLAGTLARIASRLRDDLLHIRAVARLEQGDPAGALTDLEPLLAASALDEHLQLLRMRALAAEGRRNDAVRVFAEFRARLRDELGTSPSARLVSFNAELLREGDEPPAEPKRVRIGLRASPNELVGRDADVAAVTDLLAQSRLTTILGVGGLGKTRLAHEVARRVAESTPSVVVVELASVRSGDDVPLALASTLGVGEAASTRLMLADSGARRDVRSRILSTLAEQQTLLVMDNCEHIVEAVAVWVADILDSVASVRVLATSRAPLQIAAEHVYPLDPLSSADAAGALPPAIALFIDRARAARPSASLPLDTVARLCQRLDGLPLAIELAAARIRSMSVDEIERRLGNRFALLTGRDRTAPERHRTLLAVIDWSWNLLNASEQRMLRRLSRFPDGFSAEAARVIAADNAVTPSDASDRDDDLESLVNQSLVSVTDSSRTGSVRYRMLETVREFGEMALTEAGEDAQVTEAMYRWASAFALEAWRRTYGAEQVPTFARVAEEQDNLVAVLRSAVDDRQGDVIVVVFVALAFHWSIRGAHSEVVSFAGSVSEALTGYEPDAGHTEAALATWTVIAGASFAGNTQQGLRALVRTKRLARGHEFEDLPLGMLVHLMLSLNDMAKAQQVLAEHRASDNALVAGFANVMTAQFFENTGEIDSAENFARVAYDNARLSGDSWLTAMAAQTLAQLNSQRARPLEALEWARAAEPPLRALESDDDLRQLDWLVALNEISSGHPELARPTLERLAAADAESAGFDYADLRSIAFAGLAEIAAAAEDLDDARRLYTRGRDVFREVERRAAPWSLSVASAFIVVSVRAGATNDQETRDEARRLRTQILVSHRMRSQYSDRPVLGSAVLGLALWLLAPDRVDATDADHTIGIELLALSHALSGREDLPSLNWERARTEIAATHPHADIAAACARAETLTMDERTEHAIELLRDRRVRQTVARPS
ncbi:BTAD domain-containing putative transcriptional regulator [Okibacterium endophyticum]